jgi:sarcosine oxidase
LQIYFYEKALYINQLLKGYEDKFKIYRQVLYWFELSDNFALCKPDAMPIFIWMFGDGPDDLFYGFPTVDGNSLKIAREEFQNESDPDNTEREVAEEEIAKMFEKFVKGRLNEVNRNCAKALSCLYTVTPDSRFVVDFHPEHKEIIIASPCSGHGFKHSAAIGEALAELATDGKSKVDLSKFKLEQNT